MRRPTTTRTELGLGAGELGGAAAPGAGELAGVGPGAFVLRSRAPARSASVNPIPSAFFTSSILTGALT
ncbi:MAG TPA: hypothetical protein DEA08_32090 [Planctomycetes bacterium]|nr:hypothetical protein [Planctomycetota bacterium]